MSVIPKVDLQIQYNLYQNFYGLLLQNWKSQFWEDYIYIELQGDLNSQNSLEKEEQNTDFEIYYKAIVIKTM